MSPESSAWLWYEASETYVLLFTCYLYAQYQQRNTCLHFKKKNNFIDSRNHLLQTCIIIYLYSHKIWNISV